MVKQPATSKQEIKKKKAKVKTEAMTPNTIMNLANTFLPEAMRLRIEEGIIRLYVYLDTGLVDKEKNRIAEWRLMHEMYKDKNKIDFLQGFIKGIETIANFERMIQVQTEQAKLKVDPDEIKGVEYEVGKN